VNMGNYTELIFGASLKKDTPKQIVDSLKYLMGEIDKPIDFPLPEGRIKWMFHGGSYYFAINNAVSKMWLDEIDKQWRLSTRFNIKNYESEIETFLEWIKPYIDGGSGTRDMYAIVMYEEYQEPRIYYLRD
jgi:hypothetical protein